MITTKGAFFITDTHVKHDPTPMRDRGDGADVRAPCPPLRPRAASIALVSHSDFGTDDAPSALKMRGRCEILRARAPDLEVDGEMQADTALSQAIRERVLPSSRLKGEANVLVMPNLDAANIAYTMTLIMADALPVGPILIGARKPAHILTPSIDRARHRQHDRGRGRRGAGRERSGCGGGRRQPRGAQVSEQVRRRRIWVAGHRGMVGSALARRFARENVELLTVGREALDLRDQSAVRAWIAANAPDAIILAAAKVGGILANQNAPADFLADNLLIATNVIEGAHRAGVERLVFIASAAAYPLLAPQPIREEALLTGPLDPTHEGYAVAKIAGIKLCETYRRQYGRRYFAALPCNLYGVNDRFDPQTSHVVPALIRKFHAAARAGDAEVVLWGSGTPRREFLYVDDLADAILFLLERL